MKFRRILITLLLMAACQPQPAVVPSPEPEPEPVPQEEAPYLAAKADVKTVTEPGSLVTVLVRSNYDWAYSIDSPLLVEHSVTDSTLVLSSRLNRSADETVSIKIISGKDRNLSTAVEVKVKCGLIVDFEFANDGTARDASPNAYGVITRPGVNMITYYNESAGRNVARFVGGLGDLISDGFYKFDYNINNTVKEGLADGHSMEVMFMLGQELGSVGEVKPFSSMEQGGTGFLITDASRGREITFLPNTTDADGKSWRWCRSGIVPEVGRYYHVVGVWDKAAGKARIYVDGSLCATVDAAGSFNFPSGGASQWFAVGGDPSGASCQSTWNGDIVIARIYDVVLDDAAVASLWAEAPKNMAEPSIQISNVLYLSECQVAPGGQFVVAGDGFKAGDKLIFEGSERYECSTVIESDRAVAVIPAGLASDTYKILVGRGAESAPIGGVQLTVTEHPRAPRIPKIVAHRGFHMGGRPENSIAALKAAQDGGYYGSECDLWITTDGVIYINHDGVISGKKIQDCSSADLASVTLSNGEPLPTLQQYLAQAKLNTSTRLVIEIKQHSSEERSLACTDEMLRQVSEAGLSDYVDYISFSLPVCKRIAAARPGATVGYLTSTKDLSGLRADGINCIDFAYTYLFPYSFLFDEAHGLGMTVNIWTIDSASDMMRAIGLGADYITTNRPDILADIVDRFF